MKLTFEYMGDRIILDEFFKTLMFQQIMDARFSQSERDVLLVILRQTIHYSKFSDRICIHHLSVLVGVGLAKLRQTLKQLEAKGLLTIEQSKGGRTESRKKFSKFSLSQELISLVVKNWIEIKENNEFELMLEQEHEDDIEF